MPLKLVPPREGKSPNWSIRGTHLRVYVDTTSGTHKRSLARARLAELEGKIERGEYPAREAPARDDRTFLAAAIRYLEVKQRSRRQTKLVNKLGRYFGETPIDNITGEMVEQAALTMHPN